MPIHRSEANLFFKLVDQMDTGGEVMTFGTQSLLCSYGEMLEMFFRRNRTPADLPQEMLKKYVRGSDVDCIAFFKLFGFPKVTCADVIEFHDETYVHDLSTPLPEEMNNRFSLVWDGFTGYHVCNPMEVLLNSARITKPGGTVVHTLLMNLLNVGFFRINPRFFTRFYEENGFTDLTFYILRQGYESMIFKYEGDLHDFVLWENGNTEDILFFTARKEKDVPPVTSFLEAPYEVLSKEHARTPEDVISEVQGKKVAVWGTGGNYRDNYRDAVLADDRDFDFVGFIDNAPTMQGTTLDGHPVHSPDVLAEEDVDVVILASAFSSTIFEQMAGQFPHKMKMLNNTWQLYRWEFERKAYKRRTVQFRVKNNLVYNNLMK